MIEKSHARALRHADALCFDHLADGTGRIRAIRRQESTASGFEETVTVPVESSGVANYGPGDGPWTGFAMLMHAQSDAVARTLVRHIRAGSRIAFEWVRDNNSDVIREAGLHVDELRVKVQNGNTCDTFAVARFVGHDNTARMIRRAL